MVCLAPIGQLKQLTSLTIKDNDNDVTEQGLMLLAGLPMLQELSVGEQKHISGVVIERFWAAIWQQQNGG
jgi:hypothetical protein